MPTDRLIPEDQTSCLELECVFLLKPFSRMAWFTVSLLKSVYLNLCGKETMESILSSGWGALVVRGAVSPHPVRTPSHHILAFLVPVAEVRS